jgi:Methyltransferase domain
MMSNMKIDFPELDASHLYNAKLYARREDLIAELALPAHPCICEVGVALGTFSKHLIQTLRPSSFHGLDLFMLHLQAELWGQKTSDVLLGMTHADFYRHTMKDQPAVVSVREGPSQETLAQYPDEYFDMIYVDADHTYAGVKADAELAARKVKPAGVLVFNDYLFFDPLLNAEYGVVPVVNEMVAHQGWKVIGFALQKHMFCDIAIRRS